MALPRLRMAVLEFLAFCQMLLQMPAPQLQLLYITAPQKLQNLLARCSVSSQMSSAPPDKPPNSVGGWESAPVPTASVDPRPANRQEGECRGRQNVEI